jgi:hypothetical protein
MQTRVGKNHSVGAGLIHDLIPIEQKIKIDRPRPFSIAKVSTEAAFRLKQYLHESFEGQFRFHVRDQIKKRASHVADRLGLISGGIAPQRASGEHAQQTERAGAIVTTVPEIRTDADVSFHLWHGLTR